jgi:DNA-binding transcriptional MerR regulator
MRPASHPRERPPLPTAGSLERVLQIRALREEGWSLDEIGMRFEVSRERVRQILHAHGGPDLQDVAEARRRRVLRRAEARVDELLALWRAGESPRGVAGKLDLQVVACRITIERFATDVDRAARRGRLADARGIAATGWRGDVEPNHARRPRWTEMDCWAALRRAVDDLGEVPTVVAYGHYAAGRSDLPSSATIRNRLGRWSSLATRLAAERELAEQAQVRAQTARQALACV